MHSRSALKRRQELQTVTLAFVLAFHLEPSAICVSFLYLLQKQTGDMTTYDIDGKLTPSRACLSLRVPKPLKKDHNGLLDKPDDATSFGSGDHQPFFNVYNLSQALHSSSIFGKS